MKSSIRGVRYRKDAEAEIAVVTAGEGEKDGLNGDAQTGIHLCHSCLTHLQFCKEIKL